MSQPDDERTAPEREDIVLTEAIGRRCCPICLILEEKTHGLLCRLQYDAVHDNKVKEFVITSGGYCHFHFWYLDRLASPTTNAQLLDALLERIRIDFLNCQNSPQRVPARFTTDVHCPVCSSSYKWEEDLLALFSMKIKEEKFRAAYLGSRGLCLPHLAKVLGPAPDKEIRGFLVAAASRQLDLLIEELRLQVTKWRNKDRSSGEEQDSTYRAVEKVVGRRNYRILEMPLWRERKAK
jgi:hypothetical protein